MCVKRMSTRLKGKCTLATVIRLAMVYGLGTVPLTKRQEMDMEVAKMRMYVVTRLE